ncbi:molybdenum cofactor biosynthesis protein MoaE [Sandaracinobacteroides hominis]|uniref:molybdenum cofactor biosynthesis protein MoaE n=1 Tax=Sandaracinobacteroides hominis TaxID=2780086 RepID=UPI0018F6D754|nr:molybdenum cofactor biosynthesis protein MoaE [Sandaracinobacteroides hominis]
MFEVRVQRHMFDLASEHARLAAIGPDVGAIVSFTGQVRDEPLELEHYPAMAERQMEELLAEARSRWPLKGALLIHRHGRLETGAPIVLVLTASSHRAEAFQAAAFLMDWLKTRAPFWKKDANGWVSARESDEQAASKWEDR